MERDRHIIVFGGEDEFLGDEDVHQDAPSPAENVLDVTPEVHPYAPDTDSHKDIAADLEAVQASDIEPEAMQAADAEPVTETVQAADISPESDAADVTEETITEAPEAAVDLTEEIAADAEASGDGSASEVIEASPSPESIGDEAESGNAASGADANSFILVDKPEDTAAKEDGFGENAYLDDNKKAEDVSYGLRPYEGGGSGNGGGGSYSYQTSAPTPLRQPKDPRYVTKGLLAVCLVITMLVSSVLGALFGAKFGGGSSDMANAPGENESRSEESQLSLSDATGSELTIAQIVDKNENAVVEILVSGTSQDFFGQMQVTEGAGSGVIVNTDGYIVTNYHVIEGANKVQVTLHNGDTYPATIIGGDNENDIAVIKINAKDLSIAEIGDSDKVDVGDTAVAIGNPLGQLGGTATTGIISALDRKLTIDGRTLTLLQTDAAINGGNSGGGLFNSRGELIGIVDAKSSGVGIEGLAFAIPINAVKDIINDLIENGHVSVKPAVGITIIEVSEDNAQYYNLEAAGVYIAQVTGDNATKAGFQQGDRIISFNGEKIENSNDFMSKVRECKVGDTVTVVVSRSGQEMEIRTVLEETTVNE